MQIHVVTGGKHKRYVIHVLYKKNKKKKSKEKRQKTRIIDPWN